jgi:hypothetical protein
MAKERCGLDTNDANEGTNRPGKECTHSAQSGPEKCAGLT